MGAQDAGGCVVVVIAAVGVLGVDGRIDFGVGSL